MRFIYTEEMIQFMRDNAPKTHSTNFTEAFNKKFNTTISVTGMISACNRRDIFLGRNKPNTKLHLLSEDEMNYFLKIQYKKSSKEVAELMSAYCNRSLTPEQIKNLRSRKKVQSGLTGRFEKGQESWNKGKKFPGTGNKTSFKPGHISRNAKPLGHRFKVKEGYWVVKVREHVKDSHNQRTWEYEHHLLWEKHYGPIPKGFRVVFIDQNKDNVTIDNLMLVGNSELGKMNFHSELKPNDAELNLTKILTTKIQMKTKEVQRERTRKNSRDTIEAG